MENKVMDKSQVERIEADAAKLFPSPSLKDFAHYSNYEFALADVGNNRIAYIAGATKEAERNKEDAIGFLKWYRNYERTVLTKFAGEEQLYKIYINQKV